MKEYKVVDARNGTWSIQEYHPNGDYWRDIKTNYFSEERAREAMLIMRGREYTTGAKDQTMRPKSAYRILTDGYHYHVEELNSENEFVPIQNELKMPRLFDTETSARHFIKGLVQRPNQPTKWLIYYTEGVVDGQPSNWMNYNPLFMMTDEHSMRYYPQKVFDRPLQEEASEEEPDKTDADHIREIKAALDNALELIRDAQSDGLEVELKTNWRSIGDRWEKLRAVFTRVYE